MLSMHTKNTFEGVQHKSYKNAVLIEEAKRAELNVVEELEILTLKYKSLIEFCKISSLV